MSQDDNGKDDNGVIPGKSNGHKIVPVDHEKPKKPKMELIVRAKIFEKDGMFWVSSVDMATDFRKQHKVVIKKIREIECPDDFTEEHFTPSEYIDSAGRKQPMYNMTRDGFSFLAMGFTGKKAGKRPRKNRGQE